MQGGRSWTEVSVVFTPSLTSWWGPLSEEPRETLRTRKCLTLLTNVAHPHHYEHIHFTQGEMAICLWTFYPSQVYMPLRVSLVEIWEKYKQWSLRRLLFNGRTDQLPSRSYLLPHPPLTRGCWKLALETLLILSCTETIWRPYEFSTYLSYSHECIVFLCCWINKGINMHPGSFSPTPCNLSNCPCIHWVC